MSDVSVLSLEYRTAADLAHQVNEFVIALKKERLGLLSADAEKEVGSERLAVARILHTLRQLLDRDAEGPVDSEVARAIPGALVHKLLRERQGDLDWYLEDLEEVTNRLGDRGQCVKDTDIEILDRLASCAETETAVVFRQLMRR